MRGRAAFVLVVLLGLVVGGASCADYPRHVDPALLTLENPGPLQLFEFYGRILGFISVSDYSEAVQLLAFAEEVSAPAATLQAMDRYNLLLGSVIGELNQTEGGLAEAYEHLKWLRDALAEESLTVSGYWLRAANGTSVDLGSASASLAGVLGSSPGRLLGGLDGLNRLIDELNIRILEGFDEVEAVEALRLEGLEETSLKVAVSEYRPVVGSTVMVTGFLADSSGDGVKGRVVGVFLDGSRVGEAVTDAEGVFGYSLSVPYRYVDGLRVWAEYWPTGVDQGSYLPSVSDPVNLSLVYNTPSLTFEAPGVMYPGKGFQLRGAVSYRSAPLEGLTVSVTYLGSTRSVVSGGDGGFTFDMSTPEAAEEGSARVTVASEARGIVGPASAGSTVLVYRLPLEVAFERPLLVFSGRDAVIRGDVRSGGVPLRGCSVRVQVGESVLVSSSDGGGGFTVSLPTGFLAPSGRQALSVVVTPAEPWVRAESLSSGFILVNTLVAVALPALGAAAVYRRRRVQTVEGSVVPRESPAAAPVVPSSLPWLSGLYLGAAELVGLVTGVRIRRSDTVREYLGAVKASLSGSDYGLFSGFSGLYERWFYGGRRAEPSPDEAGGAVEKMRKLVEQNPA